MVVAQKMIVLAQDAENNGGSFRVMIATAWVETKATVHPYSPPTII